jgi:hypothetical protein
MRGHLSSAILTLAFASLLVYALPNPLANALPQETTNSEKDGIKVWPEGYYRTDEYGNKVLEPGLYCRDAKVQDILLYFLLNYVTHAFTLKSFPGDGAIYSVSLSLLSLLFPYAGILKAWDSIRSGTLRKKPDLERAREAGALAIVGRDYGWKPKSEGGERIWCWNTTKDVRGRVSTWASLIGEADKAERAEEGLREKKYTRGSNIENDR